ncbi:glycerol-3-phosphate 1-O-acyltransferase PlsY [Shimia thalassica]|jgi:glycerol-3-phosphate acyltransferase PlsY|uniref:Glycerol-3-phosphate acyltransferase n=1 Tax=Shimia thalassica TaxID=1715693 RepID=A0A0P1IJ27_9RHOB|nr:glycerol-3-phosphate 1-O-acyltransferase PlsY [Shimia thalassica]MBU2943608.1 glycerol-3-phosphate 1-O-acyltransferase PlsY [Shimia thalassica]MDO6484687.1 glycerol-3-phosphate 1-O-acyltransferase PlsY [Shimia thalassica]MDO6501679.1 glycerol-3-phosphate 1-O-acyltransferase PlsY [Shimia thalassica]MDP2517133.1 glycerol-3-phosphate 1-O-acyltransferase PlsY [Shimia thalassica]MDP2579201.1 glycerol-3-phosphate 1-O-acyltransferase PlsY [Shimia thalassica]
MPEITHTLPILLIWAALGYLLGSIPFGMVITKILGLGNLRDIGSGNIGATNVLRTGSKPAAAATLILDGGKGAVAVLIARAVAGEDAAQIAGFMAFLGHCYPVWLGFKGGKGVATFLGLILALAWPVGIACCLTWLVTAAISRISSLSALVAASSATFWMLILGYGSSFIMGIAITVLVFWRHRENIMRIRAGTEPKIGQKS